MKNDEENKKISIPKEQKDLNLIQDSNKIDSEDYEKFKINDLSISSILYDDINEKINKMINPKKGDNSPFESLKLESEDKEKEKEENEKKEKEREEEEKNKKIKEENEIKKTKENECKIKEGFSKLEKYIHFRSKKIVIDILKLNKLILLNINNGLILIEELFKLLKNKKIFFQKLLIIINKKEEKKLNESNKVIHIDK